MTDDSGTSEAPPASPPRNLGGRPKGSPNKATALAREAFANFVAANAERTQELFDKVAENNPAKALELLAKLAEFVLPKQQRTEIEGDVGVRGQLIIERTGR